MVEKPFSIWPPDNNFISDKSGVRPLASSQRPFVEQNFDPYVPDIRYDSSLNIFRETEDSSDTNKTEDDKGIKDILYNLQRNLRIAKTRC